MLGLGGDVWGPLQRLPKKRLSPLFTSVKALDPDVIALLVKHGLTALAPTLQENAIDVNALLSLSKRELAAMVPKVGHRAKLRNAINTLRSSLHPLPPPTLLPAAGGRSLWALPPGLIPPPDPLAPHANAAGQTG